MKVVFKVLSGSNAGKEFTMPGEQFVIGRGEGCHLRPKSDEISRKHCALVIKDQKLLIKDLGSSGGTFVNDEKIEQAVQLTSGDKFRVGPLEFETTVTHDIAGKKRSKVSSIRDAAARTAQAATPEKEVDVDAFFDDDEPVSTARKFSLDDIKVVESQEELDKKAKAEEAAQKKAKKTKPKKVYGKLPSEDDDKPDPTDTREAAQDMLKQIFKK